MAEDAEAGDETGESPDPPAIAQLPEGIGLSHEDVQALLAAKNETIVSRDDPILMMVTMMNAFLTEEEKLLARHNKALTGILAAKTESYVREVKKTTDSLSESLSQASLAGVRAIFETHGAKLERFRTALFWASAIVTFSALVNLAVMAWRTWL